MTRGFTRSTPRRPATGSAGRSRGASTCWKPPPASDLAPGAFTQGDRVRAVRVAAEGHGRGATVAVRREQRGGPRPRGGDLRGDRGGGDPQRLQGGLPVRSRQDHDAVDVEIPEQGELLPHEVLPDRLLGGKAAGMEGSDRRRQAGRRARLVHPRGGGGHPGRGHRGYRASHAAWLREVRKEPGFLARALRYGKKVAGYVLGFGGVDRSK